MGKVVGLIGAASGKIGNLVYAVTNGIQVARVYQPVVSNPKTGLQTMQRAKGNLAGRISGFTPRTAIMGLGSNNRARRGEFLRNILKKAVVVTQGSNYKAKIDQSNVLFSQGSVPISVSLVNASASANSLVVNLRGVPNLENYAAYQTRIVVMVYDITTQDLIEVVTHMAVKPDVGGTAGTTIPVMTNNGYFANVYLVPMSTADGSAVSITSDVAGLDDTAIAAALSVNGNAIVFNYGRSLYVGQSMYQPA